MGLYASGGILCTQCESEGFRRITFHPDRPDVLSALSRADERRQGALPDPARQRQSRRQRRRAKTATHWAEWEDPFPKPSYLFALVAGDLAANRDSFTTMSGREVDLAIWVREADLPKTAHAMASLKAAMKWDEEVYGREYDLDLFNIVAVDDFNFGAMENKGLNIFNSRYVLADQETATDADFDAIAGVVAHEYFHNWSGDRVTCRDWFQLSLKEGFTVFRDQSFSADMGSEAVKRIDDVRLLRAVAVPRGPGAAGASGAARILYRDHQFLHRDDLQQGRRGDPHDAHDHRRRGVPQGQRPLFRAPRRAGGDVRGFRRARWRKRAGST